MITRTHHIPLSNEDELTVAEASDFKSVTIGNPRFKIHLTQSEWKDLISLNDQIRFSSSSNFEELL